MKYQLRVCSHDLSFVVILNACVGDILPANWVLVLLEMPSVNKTMAGMSVSYTHLTLPTIYSV